MKDKINRLLPILCIVFAFTISVIFATGHADSGTVYADDKALYDAPTISALIGLTHEEGISSQRTFIPLSSPSQTNFAVIQDYYDEYYLVDEFSGQFNFMVDYEKIDPSFRLNFYLDYSESSYNITSVKFQQTNLYTRSTNDSGFLFAWFYSNIGIDCVIRYTVYNYSTAEFDTITEIINPTEVDPQYYSYNIPIALSNNYLINGFAFISVFEIQLNALYRVDPGLRAVDIELACCSPLYRGEREFISITSETVVEEISVNPFQSIIDSVTDFLTIEPLPDISFGDILLISICIPLLIALLKIWLGG